MSNTPDEALQYPIGRLQVKESYSPEEIRALIATIEGAPAQIEALAATLSAKQLDTPYRPGGWTARQVIHHLADSHLNAYIRLKWTLTESTPTIKAYDEKAWAETAEVKGDPQVSIALLKTLHAKWATLLHRLTAEDLKKQFLHPETGKHVLIERQIATYAWHGQHHLGHLKIVAGSR